MDNSLEPPLASSAAEALRRSLEAIEEHDARVLVWSHFDRKLAEERAQEIDNGRGGPLLGISLGIKDIFDTADEPSEYGSPIYAGFRPLADAAVVSQLRAAGALCVGKTVTTEFASGASGKTRNPFDPTRTPGGSSSGSAAGVATRMVDIALGSQTLGSTIRPASFCGVYGFKPTHGTISTAGMKPSAPSLDTVGWFGRDVELLDRVRVVLTGRTAMRARSVPPTFVVLETDQFVHLEDDSVLALEKATATAEDAGATIERRRAAELDGLTERARLIHAYEAARSLAWERREHRESISDYLNDLIDLGERVDPAERDAILRARIRFNNTPEVIFGGAEFALYPSANGEAPKGLSSTGDRRFQALWTLLGFPALSVPGLSGAHDLPIGVQLIGRPGSDANVLAAGAWLGARLAPAS